MKRLFLSRLGRTGTGLAACTAFLLLPIPRSATPADFGCASRPVLGSRPLLVVVGDCEDGPINTTSTRAYEALFFSSDRANVEDYFRAVSNNRFRWTRAGPGVRRVWIPRYLQRGVNPDSLSNIVHHALMSVDNALLDRNEDHMITSDEFQVFSIDNLSNLAVGHTVPLSVPRTGSTMEFEGKVVELSCDLAGLMTCCHELCHAIPGYGEYGLDIYGMGPAINCGLSTMGACTTTPAEDLRSWYLDPWQRSIFGWCEPRIESMRAGGVLTIAAAHAGAPTAPVILYDPVVGPSELFLLEYRSSRGAAGFNYDTNVVGNGLALWHVRQDTNHLPLLSPIVAAGEAGWRWCPKCQGLHFIGEYLDPVYGTCPDGGTHTDAGRDERSFFNLQVNDPQAPGQHGWERCTLCQGLFLGTSGSRCPAGGGGQHQGAPGFTYSVPTSPLTYSWLWCSKCHSLFLAAEEANSHCPAGGTHSGNLSAFIYGVSYGHDPVNWNEGPPDFARGSATVWGSNAATPFLRWLDGSQTGARIHIRPFSPEDGSITIEWFWDSWVDFNFAGSEDGSFEHPFNTFDEGVNAVLEGATLHIKAGASAEAMTVRKRMTLQAYNGLVTIGRP